MIQRPEQREEKNIPANALDQHVIMLQFNKDLLCYEAFKKLFLKMHIIFVDYIPIYPTPDPTKKSNEIELGITANNILALFLYHRNVCTAGALAKII